MNLGNVNAFPFPTPPDHVSVSSAIHSLITLGALDATTQQITTLGRTLAAYPLAPRFAKMLVMSKAKGCLSYAIAIVSSLSVESLFLTEAYQKEEEDPGNQSAQKAETNISNMQVGERDAVGDDGDEDNQPEEKRESSKAVEEKDKAERKKHASLLSAIRKKWQHPDSDLLTNLRVLGGFDFASESLVFCQQNFLHSKSVMEAQHMRRQLTRITNQILASRDSETLVCIFFRFVAAIVCFEMDLLFAVCSSDSSPSSSSSFAHSRNSLVSSNCQWSH